MANHEGHDTNTDRRLKLKELARQKRREAYQKAKAAYHAKRQERAAQGLSPEDEERRRQLKEKRRLAYVQAKEAHKRRLAEQEAERVTKKEREEEEEAAARRAELMATLRTADKLDPNPSRPKLRLIKS